MSLGGGADEALDAAVRKSIDAGVTYALTAGNASSPVDGSPARVEEALTVASSAEGDEQSSFSNYGEDVDLYALGSDITSTWAAGDDATEVLSGTSMEAPHVAGAAALYLAGHQDAVPADVAKALTHRRAAADIGASSADPVGSAATSHSGVFFQRRAGGRPVLASHIAVEAFEHLIDLDREGQVLGETPVQGPTVDRLLCEAALQVFHPRTCVPQTQHQGHGGGRASGGRWLDRWDRT